MIRRPLHPRRILVDDASLGYICLPATFQGPRQEILAEPFPACLRQGARNADTQVNHGTPRLSARAMASGLEYPFQDQVNTGHPMPYDTGTYTTLFQYPPNCLSRGSTTQPIYLDHPAYNTCACSWAAQKHLPASFRVGHRRLASDGQLYSRTQNPDQAYCFRGAILLFMRSARTKTQAQLCCLA